MLRRPRGQAAQIILEALKTVEAQELSINELERVTELAVPTLRDNVSMLRKQGKTEVRRDEGNVMWVSLARDDREQG